MSVALTILVFALVLVALIVVHEFGHFVMAKLSGMRVDEFGIGYPPRLYAWKKGETEYSLNWLPFGGFVRIYGEDEPHKSPRAFNSRPRILQAAVLLAGIVMNLLFAYVLVSAILFVGTPRALAPDEVAHARNLQLAVADVLPGSPAARAGFEDGDLITRMTLPNGTAFTGSDPSAFLAFVTADTAKQPLTFTIERNGKAQSLSVTPVPGVVSADPTRPALGVAVATIGILPVPLLEAPIQGAQLTLELIKETAVGLWQFFAGIFTFHANLSQVTGPVGIANVVGAAYAQGFTTLLSVTALISINLALINLIPIPALDGGRLLFVIIEAVTRKPIKPVIAQRVNAISFAALILLMLVVTAHDVFRLVG